MTVSVRSFVDEVASVDIHLLAELKTHLKTFNIPLNATLELTPHSREHTITVEAFLTSMIKQNYLDRIKVGTAGAPRPTQGKLYILMIYTKSTRLYTNYYQENEAEVETWKKKV